MYARLAELSIKTAMQDTPVVLLNGARQTGKTTLIKSFTEKKPDSRYLTLDDPVMLNAAKSDPISFIADSKATTIIDEIQKAPELLPVIKKDIDENRQPGRFLLTGSADVLSLPATSESLAGRIEIITLWPLAMAEISASDNGFLTALLSGRLDSSTTLKPYQEDFAVFTGYPEPLQRKPDRRDAWFQSYTTTILQRDIRDLAQIDGFTEMPRLLQLLAIRTGALLNFSELSRTCGIPATTLKRYLALLAATFLYCPLPAWHRNIGKRLSKSPKIYLLDNGLTAHLAGYQPSTTNKSDLSPFQQTMRGPLLEQWVINELRKQIPRLPKRVQLYHYRTSAGAEIDLLIETAQGQLVAVEIKAKATIRERDFSAIKSLAETIGDQFICGVVLYTGEDIVAFGPNLYAVPITAVWQYPINRST